MDCIVNKKKFHFRNRILRRTATMRNKDCFIQVKKKKKRTRTNNKLNPHMILGPGVEPGPHWWEASALATAPSLLPAACSLTEIKIFLHCHLKGEITSNELSVDNYLRM